LIAHTAEKKYDLNQPTLVYAVRNGIGHVGYVARESGVKKISSDKFLEAFKKIYLLEIEEP